MIAMLDDPTRTACWRRTRGSIATVFRDGDESVRARGDTARPRRGRASVDRSASVGATQTAMLGDAVEVTRYRTWWCTYRISCSTKMSMPRVRAGGNSVYRVEEGARSSCQHLPTAASWWVHASRRARTHRGLRFETPARAGGSTSRGRYARDKPQPRGAARQDNASASESKRSKNKLGTTKAGTQRDRFDNVVRRGALHGESASSRGQGCAMQ